MGKRDKRKRKHKYTAETADKHQLYELSVQCVEADLDLMEKTFRKKRKRHPRLLKEDFCGTAKASAEFVSRHKKNRAWGVDLDESVLEWGMKHNIAPLGKAAKRVTLIHDNVLHVTQPKVDVTLALNFSYFIFKERKDLVHYFKQAYKGLKSDGIFFIDMYGGTEAQDEMEEKTKKKHFTYVWDQYRYDPVTNEVLNYIHFDFPDGTRMKRAFEYDWRLWTVKELTEALIDAGFASADVYWEGWDDDCQEGDGKFKKVLSAESSAGWVSYIVAAK